MTLNRGRDWPWVLALLLLASVTGETIASANTPPVTYLLAPATLPFFVVGYGCWALLFREAWARGRFSPVGAVIAGVGYTAFNEGLIAQTWFRAGTYGASAFRLGRLAGVNWCLVVGLCIFHTLFSMAMPIALVQLRRGERCWRPWLGRRGIGIASTCIGALILLMMLNPAVSHDPYRVAAAVIAVTAPVLALRLPARLAGPWSARRPRWPGRPERPDRPERPVGRERPVRPRAAFGAGAGWAIAFYLSLYGVPALVGAAAVLAEIGVAIVALRYLTNRPSVPGWSAAHWVALIAGALTPALIFDAFRVTSLETVAVALAVVGLVRLYRRCRRPGGDLKNGIDGTSMLAE